MSADLHVPLLQADGGQPLRCGPNWCSRLLFYWTGALLTRGWQRPLETSHLFPLDEDLKPTHCTDELWCKWSQERSKGACAQPDHGHKPSLLLAFASAYGRGYAAIGLLKLGGDILNFAGPLVLNQLVVYLQSGPEDDKTAGQLATWLPTSGSSSFGYLCVALLAITSLLKAVLNTQYTYQQGRITCKLRSALTCMVFKKTLLVSASDMAAVSGGAVQTFMSVDADRVVNLCPSVHELWSLPAQICIALYLLWTQVRGAFVAGLAVVLLLVPINRWLAHRIEAASAGMMAHKDARIKATAELLRGIRQIKACAWEAPFLAQIEAARTGELQHLAVRKYLDALCVFFWAVTSLVFSLATFGAFILLGHELSAATVFTSLALFNVLIAPLNAFPWVVNGIVEAVVSARRLQGFLNLPEIKSAWAYPQQASQRTADADWHDESELGSAHAKHPETASLLGHSRPSQQAFGSMFFARGSGSSGGGGFGSGIDVAHVSDSAPSTASTSAAGPGIASADDGQLEVVTEVPDDGTARQAIIVELTNASFNWLKEGSNRQLSMSYAQGLLVQPTLSDVSLRINPGSLTVVTGSPGAGKSALLMALLGELVSCRGAALVHGSVAYAAQDPWIMSASIRENILFGMPFDGVRYADVLHACALVQDIRSMSAGDATYAGDRGSALSGGQRMRIALARAIYQDSDIYLLDDVLAALDAHVAAWIIDHAICGRLLRHKTRLVCTHSDALTQRAGRVLHMWAGSIASDHAPATDTQPADTGSDAQDAQPGAACMLSSCLRHAKAATAGEESQDDTPSISHAAGEQVQAGVQAEAREAGRVKWRVHFAYMKATGWVLVCIILGSLLLMQVTRNGSDLWLSYWVAHIEEDYNSPHAPHSPSLASPSMRAAVLHMQAGHSLLPGSVRPAQHAFLPPWPISGHGVSPSSAGRPGLRLSWLPPETSFHFSVLVLIAAANSLFTMVRAFSFAAGGLAAAQRLHQKLLHAVSRAPVAFFDLTPTGRILNRFSSDTVMADDSLPFILNIFLANAAAMLGIMAVLLICQPLLAALFLPIGIIYKILQSYYQNTAREVRRLGSVVRSPVYSTFSEALAGAVTIRAFGAQRMTRLNEEQVGMLQRANITALALQQWLSLRLQCLAAAVVTAVALLGVLQHLHILPPFLSGGSRALGAGAVGLSLSYALPLTGLLNGLLTSSSETEQEMVSVERVLEYTGVQPEAVVKQSGVGVQRIAPPVVQLSAWPSSGDVTVDSAWLQYKPEGPPALAGITLHVPAGQKLGICGRTGAGKSSLLNAMLRMTDLDSGAVSIGSIDICHIPLMRLRRALAYIPQTPFLFEGTIRSNLDPMAAHSDRELIAALKHVRLWDVLCGLSLSHAKGEQAAPPAASTSPRLLPSHLSINTSVMPTGTPPRSPRSPMLHSPTRMRRQTGSNSPRRHAAAATREARAGFDGPHDYVSAPHDDALLSAASRSSPERKQSPRNGQRGGARIEPPSRRTRPASPKRSRPPQARAIPEVRGIPKNLSPVLAPPPVVRPPDSPTSLARFCTTMWGHTLASETTAVLVNAGIGGQLLSLPLGEQGAGLSQGQQQLLAVARVLLKKPRVVLLDECAANVDAHIARQVQALLHKHLADSTIIEVAHRMATVMACEAVAVLEAGRLVETGSPADLLATPGSAFAALHAVDQDSGPDQ